MERLSVCAAMMVGMSLWAAPQVLRAVEEDPFEKLLDALAQVESRNRLAATGDNGRAIGVYQIHRSYWAEGTRILGVDWEYEDARDPQKARQVVRAYLCRYGRGKSLLDMARIHNGGPRGHEKTATLAYARKIDRILNAGV